MRGRHMRAMNNRYIHIAGDRNKAVYTAIQQRDLYKCRALLLQGWFNCNEISESTAGRAYSNETHVVVACANHRWFEGVRLFLQHGASCTDILHVWASRPYFGPCFGPFLDGEESDAQNLDFWIQNGADVNAILNSSLSARHRKTVLGSCSPYSHSSSGHALLKPILLLLRGADPYLLVADGSNFTAYDENPVVAEATDWVQAELLKLIKPCALLWMLIAARNKLPRDLAKLVATYFCVSSPSWLAMIPEPSVRFLKTANWTRKGWY